MGKISRYRFGLFELDLEQAELRRDGRRQPLQDLPLRLLGVLVESPGRVVSRQELREALWSGDVHVDFEGSLNAAIRRLREALGESASDPRYVETVPRRGYRFLAPVSIVEEATAKVATSEQKSRPESTLPADSEKTHPEVPATVTQATGSRLWPVVVAVCGLLLWLLTARFGPKPAFPEESQLVAVMPLEVLGDDERLSILAAGLTEELIVRLGQVAPEHLGVVTAESARKAGDENAETAEVGRRLGVSHIVEGVMRAENESVRVSARLVKTSDRSLLWSASFDRHLGSLLELERELAEQVTRGLQRELFDGAPLPADLALTGRAATRDIEAQAYEYYLRGRYFMGLQTPEGYRRAEFELRAALDRAPDFADGWASLAQTHAQFGMTDIRRPHDAFPEAEVAVARAFAIDADNPEARVAQAMIDGPYRWRVDAAIKQLREVTARWPSHVGARRFLGLCLSALGRHEEALEQLEAARLLDPLSLDVQITQGWIYFLAGRVDEAIATARGVLELNAGYLVAWDDLKWYLTVAGREQDAAEAFYRVVALEGDINAEPTLRAIYAREGFRGLLEVSLESQLRKAGSERYYSPYDVALTFATLGRSEDAIDWLEMSVAEREVDLMILPLDPRMASLHAHPSFEPLVARIRAGTSLN